MSPRLSPGGRTALAPRLILALAASATAAAQEPARPAAAKANAKGTANRLARETSPYLLLHAHNPVDWYPWGPEAFARAKAEEKPIFLSVGYSSCYWCHVMERESFMNPAIARALNENFVCIKVDREERPDVDQIYMTALQIFGGSGGWPMSLFLTPEGRPFFGGTYFPPVDRDGFEGFPTLLRRVVDAWRDHRPELRRDADRLSTLVRRTLDGATLRKAPLSRRLARDGQEALAGQFDPEYGGFGFHPENARRPKFPEPVNLVFLLDRHRRLREARRPEPAEARPASNAPAPLAMVELTLDRMARGGIRDQLAGGYHRYATSRYWIVPHFEKMLYDNAQLATALLLAHEQTGDPRWKAEAEATFAFIARTMTVPEGGFASALDAEVEGEEGASYVWTREQVKKALGDGPDVDAFLQVYGLLREPNFEKGRYVLLEPRPRAEQAESLRTTPEELEARLAPLRTRLLAARDARPAPPLDDKVITSWNGLMVAAYADGFRLLKAPAYREAAEKAARFLLKTLRTPEGRLLRTYRAGRAKLPAYLEDYAFLAHGLLRLHEATDDPAWLDEARALTDRMLDDFADARGGFFATADDHEELIARPKDGMDNVLPSGNAVATRNLVALGRLTGEPRYLDAAGKTLEAFSGQMAQTPGSMPIMLLALEEYLDARPEAEGEAVAAADPLDDDGALPGGLAVVAATAEARPAEARPGETVDVAITLEIKPGWHAYANPTGVDGIPPTRLAFDAGQPARLAELTYPKGTAKVLASSGAEAVALYEGKVTLRALVTIDADAPAGPLLLKFQVAYQACNDRACLPPARLPVSATVIVKP